MIDLEWYFERVRGCPSAWTMPRFFERYTLHDGLLEGVRWSGGDFAVVAASLDPHWNRSLPEDCGRLFFVFRPVYVVRAYRGELDRRILGDARSAAMSYSEREALLDDRALDGFGRQHPAFDATLSRTIFEGITSLELEILHGEKVGIGCADRLGRVRLLDEVDRGA